ncbi:helix-turn-helix domain-containing protein [Streptomyces sp. NPDC020875]|uniref:TetR/AcrR family transcriptional regulator n=1 Tax=Streptomyces sp. NPDC020875 TaxID=3154898 RepID=UPI0033D1A9B9
MDGARPTAEARPLRRDAERNRRLIVDAGREVFAARGLAATLNDVAHHAGVGVGTVYRKFPDKQSLADAVFAGELDEIAALAARAAAEDDAFAAFGDFLARSFARAATNRGLRELMRGGGTGAAGVARARTEIAAHCTALVARAHAQGTLRKDVTAADIPSIAAMLDAVMPPPDAPPSENPPPETWRRWLAILLDGLRAPDQ